MKNRNGQEIRIVPSVAVFGVLVLLDIYLLLRYYDWQAGVFTLEMLTELSLVTVFGSGLVQSLKKWMERNPRPQREEKRKHLKHWMYILLLLVSVFMLCGFIKSIPLEIEEAATIDGCNPVQTFFLVVMPILKPTAITVAILNAMWIWNDYLLPYLVLGTDRKTIPVAIQIAMQGAYGATDYGGLMAMLVLAIIPIVIFYLSCQKYIIKGVIAGAVKG